LLRARQVGWRRRASGLLLLLHRRVGLGVAAKKQRRRRKRAPSSRDRSLQVGRGALGQRSDNLARRQSRAAPRDRARQH